MFDDWGWFFAYRRVFNLLLHPLFLNSTVYTSPTKNPTITDRENNTKTKYRN